jgi:type VI secretion system protein ImpH
MRFRASVSQGFPPTPVAGLGLHERSKGPEAGVRRADMTVSFFGLTGPAGVLPQHYTREMIEQTRAKAFALRDFFDLFNHRLISFFYRAWEKYRVLPAYERCQIAAPGDGSDPFTASLYCLIGLGGNSLRQRLSVADESLLYFSGLFADVHRTCAGLEGILSEYFGVAVEVTQFQGQWLPLGSDQRSELPSVEMPWGRNCRLGETMVLGDRVWDVECGFRLRVGPLGFSRFSEFLPGKDALRGLFEVARSYVGAQFEFDAQLILRAGEIPELRLGGTDDGGQQLGWTSWLTDDGVRQHDGEVELFFDDV